jgi:hypothetical protein
VDAADPDRALSSHHRRARATEARKDRLRALYTEVMSAVQIIRSSDGIPFDLDQFRTIQIDTTNIYMLVPKLETYKAEIANQVRRALSDPDSVGNPLTTFYPGLKMEVPRPTGTRQAT